jgi:hypothetical protein
VSKDEEEVKVLNEERKVNYEKVRKISFVFYRPFLRLCSRLPVE